MRSFKNLDIKNKKVIIRLDLDVPIDEKGNIKDDSRLKESIPTLKALNSAKQVIIIGHLGRPTCKENVENIFKLNKVAIKLSRLLKFKIKKLDDFVNINIPDDKYIMLENLRFSELEQKNDLNFSKQLASFGEVYINDAFSVSHRKASSIVGITKFLPSFSGLKVEKEVKEIGKVIENVKSPFVLIMGGAKIDKLKILKNLIEKADIVLIGGAMMFTFLKANNCEVGKSKYEMSEIEFAKKIIKNFGNKLILPIDVILDNEKEVYVEKIPKSRAGFDIGSETTELFSEIIRCSKTIVWNGPLGFFERKPFDCSTIKIAKVISQTKCKSLVGGGDTIYSIKEYLNHFSHYSTAGGAFLEFISGKKLPGLENLDN